MLNKKMSKIAMMILVLSMVFTGCAKTVGNSSGDGASEMELLSATHYGAALLKEPAREANDNIYSVSAIEKVEGYKNFDRQVTAYGLTLMIHKDIEDTFVNKIIDTMVSMFPKLEGEQAKEQEAVLQNMYKYKAMLPVVLNESGISGDDQSKLMTEYSLCDIIMKTDQHQVNEVMEHLLHAITDVGLSYTYPSDWGFGEETTVSQLMNQAVKAKHYDISGYEGYPEEVKRRVLVQEYAYWAISSYWNLQETYGVGDSEWQLNSYDKLASGQAEMIQLIDKKVNNIMQVPSKELLSKF